MLSIYAFHASFWVLVPASTLVCLLCWRIGLLQGSPKQGANHWVHHDHVPRVGGLGMSITLVVSAIFIWGAGPLDIYITLYAGLMPLLVAVGVAEDLLGGVSATKRLVASVILIGVFCGVLGVSGELAEAKIGMALSVPLLFILLCMIGIVLIHGTNLIDGLNGLAGLWGLLTLVLLLWIADSNQLMTEINGVSIGSIMVMVSLVLIGFLILNFPLGLVFLGDAGAYLIGFTVFALATFLIVEADDFSLICRVLLAICYPAIEVFWTVVRRIMAPGTSIVEPDKRHLHSHVFSLVTLRFPTLSRKMQNSVSTVILFTLIIQIPAWVAVLMPSNIAINIIAMMMMPCLYMLIHLLCERFLDSKSRSREQPVKNQY